jgi:hypothetical protein
MQTPVDLSCAGTDHGARAFTKGQAAKDAKSEGTAARQVSAQGKAVQDRAIVGSPQTAASFFNSLAYSAAIEIGTRDRN